MRPPSSPTPAAGWGSSSSGSTSSRALKARKFDGDLDALLTWWRQNKVREYEALAAESRAAAAH
jgi:hypothetical protein